MYFTEDGVARIIVINTNMAVENIITADHCVTSATAIPTTLDAQIIDPTRSVLGWYFTFFVTCSIIARGAHAGCSSSSEYVIYSYADDDARNECGCGDYLP